ncbi:MAG: SIS domain-containing protein [Acidimicrobiales bacterium]|nr:SIS domain-containing protein [Acidimicrobiales bacterium]
MALLPDGSIDTLGYLDTVLGLPEHLEVALGTGVSAGLPDPGDVDHVVLAATGPLTTAVDLVAALARPVASVPVFGVERTQLPGFVGPRSLVLVGGRPPLGHEASDRGAAVVEFAPTSQVPVERLGAVPVAVQMLRSLAAVAVIDGQDDAVRAAIVQLRRRRDELGGERSPAARLARRIGRTLPLAYGTDPLGGAAARHWKRQVNASAKAASFANWLPGLGDAEIAGWGQHGDMTRQVFSLVLLRHDHEPAGTRTAVDRLVDLVDEVVHDRHVVDAEGEGPLAQLLDLVFYGDLVAHHLAQELEIDPGPVGSALD